MATIPAALRPRLSRRAIALLLVGALAVPLAAGAGLLALSGDSGLGEMELSAGGTGDVTVFRAGETISVDGNFSLETGDLVVTGVAATAEFNLVGDRTLDLAGETSVRIMGASAVAIEGGNALATTSDETTVTVGDVEIAAPASDAVFRMDRASSLRTGVYDGKVEVSVPAQGSLQLRELFEVSMPTVAPNIPARPDPYGLNAEDAWDTELLPEVVELDKELTATANGLATQFDRRPPLSYFQTVAGSQVKFMKPFLKQRPADLLVGLTVAEGARSDNLAGAFRRTLDLVFERGARWGVAAAIMDADPKRLLTGLNALIEKSGVTGGNSPAADAFAQTTDSGLTDADGTNGSTDGPGGTAVTDPNDDDGNEPIVQPTVKPTSSPAPSPSPTPTPTVTPTDPPEECGTDVECVVKDVDPPVDNPLDDDVGKELDGGGGSSSEDLLDL